MDKKKLVITIGRQYGSGGRIVGERLAKSLGIEFYDEKVLELTAEKSAVGEQYFRLADERAGHNFLRKVVKGLKVSPLDEPKTQGDVTDPDNLFKFQSSVIRELAREHSCVIVGRCADYILEAAAHEDLIRIFVYADTPTCIRRTMEVDGIEDTKVALEKLDRITKQRSEYHKYYTGRAWDDIFNYDLPINSTNLELEQIVELILTYIRMRGYDV